MNPRPHRFLPSTLLILAIGAGPVRARPVEPGHPEGGAQSGVALSEAYRQVGGWSSLSGAQLPPLAFNKPSGLGLDLDPFSRELGVYVADSGNHRIQVFSAEGPYRQTIGGPGPLPTGLNDPVDVAVQGSLVFVADRGHNRVALFTTEGQYVGQWTDLADPAAIAVSPTGRIAVIEQQSSQIAIYQADGRRLATWGGFGEGPGKLNRPRGMAFLADGRLAVADSGNERVITLDAAGRQLETSPLGQRPLSLAVEAGSGDLLTLLANGEVWRLADQATLPPRLDPRGRLMAPGAVELALARDGGGISHLFASIQDDATPFHGLQHWTGSPPVVPPDGGRWGDASLPLGLMEGPFRLAAGREGAWVADRWPRLQLFDAQGQALRQVPSGRIQDLTVMDDGALLTAGEDMLWWSDPQTGREIGATAPALLRDYRWLVAAAKDPAGGALVLDLGGQALWRWDDPAREAALRWTWTSTDTLRVALWDLAPGPAGLLWTVNRSADSLELRSLTDGLATAAWSLPGRPVRVAADAAGNAFVLNAFGWVLKLAPDGRVLAAFDARGDEPESGGPSDLTVDGTGRVLVSDGLRSQVRAYAPDPAGDPGLLPDFAPRCRAVGDKFAMPTRLLLGETTGLTLRIRGECPEVESRSDIVLILDHSGSMTGAPLDAAKTAAEAFINSMSLGRDRIAVVGFNQDAALRQALTTDGLAAIDAVRALVAGGGTDIAAGVDEARNELTGPRRRLGAGSVIVLLTDGGSNVAEALRAADQAKLEGARLFTVAFGAGANTALLARMASSAAEAYVAPGPSELAKVYQTIAARLRAGVLFGSLTVTDEIPRNMAYVPGSAQPPALLSGTRLIWSLSDLPLDRPTELHYRLRPLETGTHPTNVFAVGEGLDGLGQPGRVDFPIPVVDVGAPSPTPGPSPTTGPSPTPSVTPTPSPTPRPIYLPWLRRDHCPKRVQHADVVLLVDSSDSMLDDSRAGRSKLAAAVEAAGRFVRLMDYGAGDSTGVVAFNARATVELSLSRDRGAILAALDRLPQATGTRIDLGLDAARRTLEGPGRTPANSAVVILLTDGRPTGTTAQAVMDAADALHRNGALVYSIGLGQDVDAALLRAIAREPERLLLAPDAEDLAQVYEQIARTLPCDGP